MISEPAEQTRIVAELDAEAARMLAATGYAVQLPPDEDGQEAEITFKKRDYERKFFSDETNVSARPGASLTAYQRGKVASYG